MREREREGRWKKERGRDIKTDRGGTYREKERERKIGSLGERETSMGESHREKKD